VRIFLIGLMGSGKTTIGRRLAARTGWPYLDNDTLVRDAAGRTAPEIEDAGGVAALHEAELAAFEHALTIAPPVIIGVAGFVVMDPALRARMREAGTVVWLRARPETLRTRVGAGSGRRDDATSLDWIQDVVEERSPLVGTSRLMIMFSATDMQLKQWTVTDPQGYDTTVAVYNLDSTRRPDPNLFRIDHTRYRN